MTAATPHPDAPVSSRPRLLWLIPEKPDNISTGRQRIATGLEARGYDVTIRADVREHARTQLANGYDVFMATSAFGGLFGPSAKVLQRKPFVFDHVDPIRQLYSTMPTNKARIGQALKELALRLSDGILYVYKEEQERLSGRRAPVRRTSLGVDYDRFANAEPSPVVREWLDSAGVRDDFVVYIGGLEPIYNIETMVNAAGRMGLDLVIAGCGSKEDIVKTAADTTANVHYLGVVEHAHIPALLQEAAAGICLADDPHTVKVLEYAAAGLPIVQIDGRARGVLPNEGVWWVADDPADVAAGMTDAASADIDESALQDYARDRDYSLVINQYDSMLRRVMRA